MADAVAVPASGGIPQIPAAAPAPRPQAPVGGQVTGFPPVPQIPNQPAQAAPAGVTYTQAQVDAMLAAAGQPKPAAPTGLPGNLSAGINVAPPAQISGANDPVLTSMTSMMSSAVPGLDISRAIGRALEYGDANLIDVAYLREKGGDNAGHLQTMATALVQRVQSQAAAGEQAVYAAVGGQANWAANAALFDSTAAPHLKTVIKTMMDSGNIENISAAAKMVAEHCKATGRLPAPGGLVAPGAAGGSAAGMSKADFQAELFKLNPNTVGFEQARGDLFYRRQLGKQLGL